MESNWHILMNIALLCTLIKTCLKLYSHSNTDNNLKLYSHGNTNNFFQTYFRSYFPCCNTVAVKLGERPTWGSCKAHKRGVDFNDIAPYQTNQDNLSKFISSVSLHSRKSSMLLYVCLIQALTASNKLY